MEIQTKPIVLRIKGAMMEEAQAMLKEELKFEIEKGKKQNIFFCDCMDELARKAVKVAIDEQAAEMEAIEQQLM